MSQKYIIAVLILAAVVGGGILGYQYLLAPREEVSTPTTEEPEEITEDETASWKTYRNEEYDFEVKYPAEWEAKEPSIIQGFRLRLVPEVYATEPLNFYQFLSPDVFRVEFKNPQNEPVSDLRGVPNAIVVTVRNPKNNPNTFGGIVVKNLDAYEQVIKGYFKEGRVVNQGTLDGKPAIYSRRNTGTGDENIEYRAYGSGYEQEVAVFFNDLLYTIHSNGDYYDFYFELFLSSFNFLK